MLATQGQTAAWLCLLLALHALPLPAYGQGAFLQDALPLKPLAATPVQLLDEGSASVTLTGRQAITAVFSRPVIALGSDFGQQALPANLVPFSLTCGTPGRLRWVTTNIARFDPSVDWPTDLACSFVWNKDLKTYDGAPLQLGSSRPQVPLTTQPLAMSLESVVSERASNVTDDLWSATVGLPDDNLPEVPPDGNITLTFSYPVELSRLQAALKVTGAANIAARVSPCPPPVWIPIPLFAADGASSGTSPPNTTCALVRLSPALKPGQAVELQLPAGARYNSLAGPLGRAQSIKVFGLRRFRVPLRQDFEVPRDGRDVYDGIRYRRLSLWLPHGLAQGTPVTALAPLITLCAAGPTCQPLPFTIKLVSRGQAQLSVPGLVQRTQYSISVKSSSQVKDAFGLGLEASSTKFWTPAYDTGFKGPETTTNVALLEATAGSSALTWPLVSRGSSDTVRDAEAWQLDAGSDAQAARLMYLTTGWEFYARGAFGGADKRVSRSNSTTPAFYNLTLSGSPGIQAVATCCRTVSYPSPHPVSDEAGLVVTSDLQAAFVHSDAGTVAWITSVKGGAGSTGVAGAKVQLYNSKYENTGTQTAAAKGASCTTGADGTCTIAPSNEEYSSGYTGALVDAGSRGVLVVPRLPYSARSTPAVYQGKLVLDRALVKPGDDLHVTGYIQRQEGPNLRPPSGLSTATLEITPNFDSTQSEPLIITTPVDPKFGSVHATVKVPPASKVGDFSVSLKVAGRSGGSSSSLPESVDSASFVVSDPRPPTAELNLTAPPWVRPTDTVTVSVTANSYLGSPLPSAPITIDWNTPQASGNVSTTTDAKGAAEVKLPLGQLPAANRSSAGDQLSITATYIGPTRERIISTASVSIADGPTRVTLATTLETDLPGLPFGVSATAFSNSDDSQLPSVPITISLVAADEPDALASCSAAQRARLASQTCTAASGNVADAAKCQITLPCAGRFALRGCVSGSCSNVTLGRNASDWQRAPWAKHDTLKVLPDRSSYALGDSVSLYGQNAGFGPTAALVVWGNALAKKQLIIQEVPRGPFTAKIGPLGEECRGGCSAMVVLAVRRPDSAAGLQLPDVPRSLLFDPLAPHTLDASVTLTVLQNKPLSVAVAVESPSKTTAGLPVVAPGSSAPITVKVTNGGVAVAGAEVTLIAVDKAVLDLVPYALQNVTSGLQASVSTYYQTTDVNGLRLQRSSLEAVFEALRRRLALDPALPLETGVSPFNSYRWGPGNEPVAPVDVPDDKYLDGYTTPATVFPPTCWFSGRVSFCPLNRFSNALIADSVGSVSATGGVLAFAAAEAPATAAAMVAPAPAPAPKTSSAASRTNAGAGGAAASSSAPRLQSAFKTTPLFQVLRATTAGTAGATFTAPQNLGAFVLRAYVASDAGASAPTLYGSAETELVIRRPLSLTPSVPRAVRVGDTFRAGVLVSAPGATAPETVTVTVSLVTGDALALAGADASQRVTLTPAAQQQEVRFEFIARSIGNASVSFSAAGPNSASDAVVLSVPVLGRQGDVFVATSFAVRSSSSGNGNASRAEGLALPAAEPGSGSVDLLAGVGYLPAVHATYKSLVDQDREYAEGAESMALATLPNVLALYHPGQAANSWLSAAEQRVLQQALTNLTKLTDGTYGLLPIDPSVSPWFTPRRADITLCSWAAWLAKQAAPPAAAGALLSRPWEDVASQATTWREAAAMQLIKDAQEARASRPPGPYSDFETLSWARLALGANWVPEGVSAQIRDDLSMARLSKALGNLTTGARTRVALALLEGARGAQRPAEVAQVVRALTSATRVGGRTAYVASGLGERSAAGLSDQSLALLLFVRAGADAPTTNPLVQKLAAYVAQGPPRTSLWTCFVGTGAFEGALQGLALSAYDAAGNSTNPNLDLTVAAGPKTLLTARFTPSNAGTLANSSTPWDALPRNSSLQFTAAGSGEVSVAASLRFVPSQLLPYPQYRGLWVQRAVQLAGANGGNLASAPLASAITMIVQVTSPDDLGQVTVEVMMPGGLEPLDPNVYGDAGAATTCGFSQEETNDLVPPSNSPGIFASGPGGPRRPVGLIGVMPKRRLLQRFSGSYFSFPPWLLCPAQQTRPSVVTFTYNSLSAGTHTIAFQAIAATSGTFTLPPVKAYANNQPELMGLSPAGNLTICVGSEPCGSGSAGAAVAPKACPNGCSRNGVCDLASGTCTCNQGFSGADCSAF